MGILVGPIPEPEDLIGRDGVVEDAWSCLERNNLLMLGPRRFGKSGVLRHLFRKPRSGFVPLSFDLEDVTTGEEFVQRVVERAGERQGLRPLLHKCGTAVSGLVDAVSGKVESLGAGPAKVKFREVVKDSGWEVLAKKIMHSLEQSEQPLLFLFDELPEMLRKIARTEDDAAAIHFLSWFRTVRLDDRDELRRHRFVIAGSTGLNYLLDQRLGCPESLNDFSRLTVEPLEMPDAARLCRHLADGYGLTISDSVVEEILVRIGQPVPYFIQLFFSASAQVLDSGASELTVENIEFVYQDRVMGRFCKRYFDQYRRRLEIYPKPVEESLIHILVEVARSEDGVASSDLYDVYHSVRGDGASRIEFSELMADLECDWYLEKDRGDDTYRFYMSVMKDWWVRWYGSVRESPNSTAVNSDESEG